MNELFGQVFPEFIQRRGTKIRADKQNVLISLRSRVYLIDHRIAHELRFRAHNDLCIH